MKYEYLDELYEGYPSKGKTAKPRRDNADSRYNPVNHRMATLKRTEGILNRFRNKGLIK